MGFHHDSAGYALPHALRNILIICATPYEWKHMISQRICRRNTDETRIVMLDIWQKLYEFDPVLFSPKLTGPFCQKEIARKVLCLVEFLSQKNGLH